VEVSVDDTDAKVLSGLLIVALAFLLIEQRGCNALEGIEHIKERVAEKL
jgi:hypothetical protein